MKLFLIFLTLVICQGLVGFSDATPVPKKHHGHKNTEIPKHLHDNNSEHPKKHEDPKKKDEHTNEGSPQKSRKPEHTEKPKKDEIGETGPPKDMFDSQLKQDYGGSMAVFEGAFQAE